MKAFVFLAALFMLAVSSGNPVSGQETKIKWFGHAAFSITTPGGKVLLIDPWLRNPSNPDARDGKGPLSSVPKVGYSVTSGGLLDGFERR